MDEIKMKCQKCKEHFPENEIEESHDVPVFIFEGSKRNERKNQADKWGRHNLCIKCHTIYEKKVASVMINSLNLQTKEKLKKVASSFANKYFGGEKYDS